MPMTSACVELLLFSVKYNDLYRLTYVGLNVRKGLMEGVNEFKEKAAYTTSMTSPFSNIRTCPERCSVKPFDSIN